MAQGLPAMQTTIRWFNSVVFKGVANNLSNSAIPGQPGGSDDIESGIARALHGLTMGDSDDDEPAPPSHPNPRASATRVSAVPRLPHRGAVPQRRVVSLPTPAPPSPTRSIPDENDVQRYIQHQATGSRQGFTQTNDDDVGNNEELEYGIPSSLPPTQYQGRGRGRGHRTTQRSVPISEASENIAQSSTRRSSRKR
ncbi:hypothetical protein CCMSSC00406_0008057 [Pleurotus cornucopiae]|uniref:Uncharacterized protein n=1 Tax=Pleurotus cornucopiae TaxID=5321 RepID=A0ACB7IUZ0_PLECO|nr:hypothetical protein CCMSSC00406_0008057 [Pleurotus cornucopiae]